MAWHVGMVSCCRAVRSCWTRARDVTERAGRRWALFCFYVDRTSSFIPFCTSFSIFLLGRTRLTFCTSFCRFYRFCRACGEYIDVTGRPLCPRSGPGVDLSGGRRPADFWSGEGYLPTYLPTSGQRATISDALCYLLPLNLFAVHLSFADIFYLRRHLQSSNFFSFYIFHHFQVFVPSFSSIVEYIVGDVHRA